MPRLRHQLPVHSPLSARALLGAAAGRNVDDTRRSLETLLADRYDADRVVLTGSGTQALQLALQAAFRHDPTLPRAVALPAFCCYDVATAAVGADARIALYDIDPDTLAPDPDSLERVLARGLARIVVVAPLYGVPVPWDGLEALAAAHDAVLIEDAAQGHGAAWSGRLLGSLGRIGVLSFGRGKGWTGGAGGALLLRDKYVSTDLPPLAEGAGLRTLLATGAQWALGRPALYGIPASLPMLGLGETVYHAPGPVEAMATPAISLALRTRARSDAEARHRRRQGSWYLDALGRDPGVATPRLPAGAEPGWLRLPVRVPGGLDALADRAAALRLGLGRTYPTPLSELAVVRERQIGAAGSVHGAEALVRDLVTLPTHSRVARHEREAIVRLVREAAARTDRSPPAAPRHERR